MRLGLGLSLDTQRKMGASTPPLPEYQPWQNYPNSPVKTVDYPYQMIFKEYSNGLTRLLISKTPFYVSSQTGSFDYFSFKDSYDNLKFSYNGSEWSENPIALNSSGIYTFKDGIFESNVNIYSNSELTELFFAKTTT